MFEFLRFNQIEVLPVGNFFSVPTTSTVIRVGILFRVATADVRYVLVSRQCYPAVPASKNTLVLVTWINFEVGTTTIQYQIFHN